jgi:hypothetical protein
MFFSETAGGLSVFALKNSRKAAGGSESAPSAHFRHGQACFNQQPPGVAQSNLGQVIIRAGVEGSFESPDKMKTIHVAQSRHIFHRKSFGIVQSHMTNNRTESGLFAYKNFRNRQVKRCGLPIVMTNQKNQEFFGQAAHENFTSAVGTLAFLNQAGDQVLDIRAQRKSAMRKKKTEGVDVDLSDQSSHAVRADKKENIRNLAVSGFYTVALSRVNGNNLTGLTVNRLIFNLELSKRRQRNQEFIKIMDI